MADSKLKIWLSDHYEGVGIKKLLGQLGAVKSGIQSAFHSAPVQALRNAILAVGAAMVGAVVEAARFNVQVARVSTMAGGGIGTFKELREQARGLASDFGIARSEIANGMYNALSAGIDKSNLESFMTSAAKVAVADSSDISVAVDGITTVLNSFKIKAEETDSVADDMFQTVKTGKTTFSELAANLATVAPVAAASEIPLKQILAHVSTLTSQGTPTAQAMTQIRASIIGLNKVLGDGWSKKMNYQEALKKVWDMAGKSQTKLSAMVGSVEAVQAVLGGVGENADMASEKLKGMQDTAGALEEAYEKQAQFRHWSEFIETARGTLSKFGEEVDQRLRPYVVAVTDQIKQWRDDSGLWEKIGGVLDGAEAKLKQIADVIQEIKSVEDLKVAGAAIAEKITGYLLEKSIAIGSAIGDAIVARIPLLKGIGAIANTISKVSPIGIVSEGLGRINAARNSAPSASVKDQITSAREAREEISAGVKEGVKQGILEIQQSQQRGNDSERLLRALEQGLSGAALDKLVTGLELTAEDLDLLAAYTGDYNTSSKESVEAMKTAADEAENAADAAKNAADQSADASEKTEEAFTLAAESASTAGDAAEESSEIIRDAMDRQSDSSREAAEAAEDASEKTTQAVEKSTEAMNKTAEAAKKAADQTTEAGGKVKTSLDQIGQAQVETGKAATMAGELAVAVHAQMTELAARLAMAEQTLSIQSRQISNMRA